jgi:hypothetical protein
MSFYKAGDPIDQAIHDLSALFIITSNSKPDGQTG